MIPVTPLLPVRMGTGGALPPGPDEEEEQSGHGGRGHGVRGRILIVEDDYFVGLTIENALADAGHEVVAVAASGEQAIEAAGGRPEIAVVDVRLAGMIDGIEAAIELRRHGIPSLFATAHSDPDTRRRGEVAHPAGWLTKPFSSAELVAAVEAALVRLRGN